jgi:molecular chaperone GrpE
VSDEGIKVTDKRKVDPESGQVREAAEETEPVVVDEELQETVAEQSPADPVAELTDTLQRVQAEYANYRKRVDRDKEQTRAMIVAGTLAELMPILDDIGRARSHGELEGGFKSVGESLEALVSRMGLLSFGQPGDEFDPTRHEAIHSEPSSEVTVATCVAVFQSGYEFAGRVIRPAMVSVVEPESGITGESQQ